MCMCYCSFLFFTCPCFFFFNDTAPTEIYTLSLHDALPISAHPLHGRRRRSARRAAARLPQRSEEHTSELQSRVDISYAVFCLKKTQPAERSRTHEQSRQVGTAVTRGGAVVCERRRVGGGAARCELDDTPAFECFFFNDTATTEIYTLSLHDALPI